MLDMKRQFVRFQAVGFGWKMLGPCWIQLEDVGIRNCWFLMENVGIVNVGFRWKMMDYIGICWEYKF